MMKTFFFFFKSACKTELVLCFWKSYQDFELQLLRSLRPPLTCHDVLLARKEIGTSNLLLYYRLQHTVTSRQQRTLRRCPPPYAGTGVKRSAQEAPTSALCLAERQVQRWTDEWAGEAARGGRRRGRARRL